jgi:hypothetical protein
VPAPPDLSVPHPVEELVQAFAKTTDELFPDLRYLEPSGELHIPLSSDPVRGLRVQLPGNQMMLLHSIRVDTEDDIDLIRESTCTSSSTTGESLLGLLLDPDPDHGPAVHTKKEASPWVEVVFDRPITISKVVLRNCDSWRAGNSTGIQVLTCPEAGEWTTAYDGGQRELELRLALGGGLRHRPEWSHPHEQGLVTALIHVAVGAYQEARKLIGGAGWISAEETKVLRTAVSKHLLFRRKVEWTIHGVKRSFRFWTDEERRAYLDFTCEVIEDLKDLTSHACLGFGAVLALVRDGTFIPHDDDLDVLVAFEPHEATTLAEGLERISEFLRGRGYAVSGNHVAHVWVRKGLHTIDVFAGLFEGDTVSWYPGNRGSLTRDMMFPPTSAPLLGRECLIPRNPLLYLEAVYGPGWRVPDSGFRHNWTPTAYGDIAGGAAKD